VFHLEFIVVLENKFGSFDVDVAEIVDPKLVETVRSVCQLVVVETFTDAF
jgi:hypothetical protein